MVENQDNIADAGKTNLQKSRAAFRTISEVSKELGIAQHVLRFWETKFLEIQPIKRGGGRRYYRPEDLDLIKNIKNLLYKERYTIEGVQKLFKEKVGKNYTDNEPNGFFASEFLNPTVEKKEPLTFTDDNKINKKAILPLLNELKEIKKYLDENL